MSMAKSVKYQEKRLTDSEKDDIVRKQLTAELTRNEGAWKKNACCADPKLIRIRAGER